MIESIFRYYWSRAKSVIKYEKLMLSEGDAGVLDPNTGVFRASVPGVFVISKKINSPGQINI